MVEAELHLFDVRQVVGATDAGVLVEPFLGVRPESFNTINVIVTPAERLRVLDAIVLAILLQVLV